MPTLSVLSSVDGLPVPRGPFSQAVVAQGALVFISGQGPYDPAAGRFVRGDIKAQTRLTLECVDHVLLKAGSNRTRVASCRVYLQKLDQAAFDEMNTAYREFFGTHAPARTTIGAALLGIDVEIDCIALVD